MTDVKRFQWEKNDIVMSICPFCIHKHPGAAKCDAFLLGIPNAFLDGSKQHLKKTSGDLGIVFEQNPKMTPPEGLIE